MARRLAPRSRLEREACSSPRSPKGNRTRSSAKTLLGSVAETTYSSAHFGSSRIRPNALVCIDHTLLLTALAFSIGVIELRSKRLEVEKLKRLYFARALQPVRVCILDASPSLENNFRVTPQTRWESSECSDPIAPSRRRRVPFTRLNSRRIVGRASIVIP